MSIDRTDYLMFGADIAYKLETIAKRAFADQHPANKKAAATPKDHGGKFPPQGG